MSCVCVKCFNRFVVVLVGGLRFYMYSKVLMIAIISSAKSGNLGN